MANTPSHYWGIAISVLPLIALLNYANLGVFQLLIAYALTIFCGVAGGILPDVLEPGGKNKSAHRRFFHSWTIFAIFGIFSLIFFSLLSTMLAKQAPYLELVFVSGAYAFCWSYLFHLYIDNKTGVMGLPIITGDNNEERYNGVYEANWNYLSKRFITIVKARYKGMLPQKKQEHSLPLKKRFKDKFVGWFLWALAQLDLMRGQGITVKNAIIIIFSSVFSAGYIRDPVMKINYDLGLLFGSLVLFLTFYVFFVYLKNRKLEEWQVILTCAAYLCFFMSYSTVFYKYVPNILQAIIGGTFIYLPLFVLLEYFYTGRIPRINRFN